MSFARDQTPNNMVIALEVKPHRRYRIADRKSERTHMVVRLDKQDS